MKATRKKSPQEVGKEFEDTVGQFFKDLSRRTRSHWHRLYDSHSAGSFLPAQPGDGLFLYKGAQHLIEVKSSEANDSLASGLSELVSKEQAALMRFWERAGAICHYIFLDQKTGAVEWWDGAYVANTRVTAYARLKRDGICVTYPNFRAFCEAFELGLASNPRFNVIGA